jgi:RNA polymerase sigma-70 factor, ECF subfamily
MMGVLSRMRPSIEPQPESRADAIRLLLVPREASEAELVYERVAPVVNRLVWAYLATDPERDDIAQDIFLSIVRRRGSVRDPARLEAWAARVAFNAICNAFRRRKFRRWLSLEPLRENEQPKYQADVEGRELVVRAQHVLEKLPLSQRMPLTLELLSNASQSEIARLCGCSERTLRRRLQAARERFSVLARRDPALASRLTDTSPESNRDD